MAQRVTGDLKDGLLGQLFEIERQIRQSSGYAFNPLGLKDHLQEGIEGRFVKKASSLLEPLGTVAVPSVKKFVVRRNFVVDTSADAPVKISYLSDNFRQWFGDKIEMNVPGEVLRYAKLLRSSLDDPIRDEVGRAYEETKLAHVFALMEFQPSGERFYPDGKAGALLTNGYADIFYAYDITGTLRVVVISWGGGGWHVLALLVSGLGRLFDGWRVFSRNSSAAVTV